MMQGDARQLRHVLRPSIKIPPSFPSFWRSWPFKIAISLHSIYLNFVISKTQKNYPHMTLEKTKKWGKRKMIKRLSIGEKVYSIIS